MPPVQLDWNTAELLGEILFTNHTVPPAIFLPPRSPPSTPAPPASSHFSLVLTLLVVVAVVAGGVFAVVRRGMERRAVGRRPSAKWNDDEQTSATQMSIFRDVLE
ncbi:hypothetical protein M3Y99_00986200 [Aphelenchoides fujianensis]|nr:hypothetical protein M3Y99_00986200 [Aphelenchoides fujianensis]